MSHCRYASSEPVYNTVVVPEDLFFKKSFEGGNGPRFQHVRNVRYWDCAVLDIVRSKGPYSETRKRLICTKENEHASERAENEAKILRKVKHTQIVNLRSTYIYNGQLTLHFQPAADFDLRTFLDLVEIRFMKSKQQKFSHSQLEKDLRVLTESFGCLSNALATIHEAGYDHGELRPENILVHDGRVYISKFSYGLEHATSNSSSGSDSSHRFIDRFGGMGLRRGKRQAAANRKPPHISPKVVRGQYLTGASI